MKKFLKKNWQVFLFLSIMLALSSTSLASTTNLPWEGPLEKLLKSFTGPVAKAISIMAVVG